MKKFTEKRQSKPKIRIKEVVLQGPDFILEFENNSDGYSEFPYLGHCNLSLPKTVNKGKYNERTELKWVCSPTTKSAIGNIILYRMINSGNNVFKAKGDEGLALFFKSFREERNKLISSLTHTEEEWMNLLQCDKKKKSYKAIIE